MNLNTKVFKCSVQIQCVAYSVCDVVLQVGLFAELTQVLLFGQLVPLVAIGRSIGNC